MGSFNLKIHQNSINVSVMTCHFSGTTGKTVKSWKAAPEEMSLEATAKDGQ